MYGVILGVDFIFDLQNTFTHLKTRENVESFCKTVFRAVAVINGCKVSTTPLLRTIESRKRDFSHQACFLPPRMPQCRMIPQNISVIELVAKWPQRTRNTSCQGEILHRFRKKPPNFRFSHQTIIKQNHSASALFAAFALHVAVRAIRKTPRTVQHDREHDLLSRECLGPPSQACFCRPS